MFPKFISFIVLTEGIRHFPVGDSISYNSNPQNQSSCELKGSDLLPWRIQQFSLQHPSSVILQLLTEYL